MGPTRSADKIDKNVVIKYLKNLKEESLFGELGFNGGIILKYI
jgi:hypothetical protein